MQRDEQPTYTREMLHFAWRDNDPVYVYVLIPKLSRKPPAIIYLYDYTAEITQFADNKLDEFLTKDGFAAVAFVSALSSHRYHDRPMKQWFVSELQESLAETTHDVQLILNYLQTRPDIDSSHIGMYGDGSGGSIGILAAAADPRIKALLTVNPWAAWPDWLRDSPVVPNDERENYLRPDFLKKVAPLDPVRYLPQLAIPLRVEYLGKSQPPASVETVVKSVVPPQANLISSDQALAEYKVSGATPMMNWLKSKLRSTVAN